MPCSAGSHGCGHRCLPSTIARLNRDCAGSDTSHTPKRRRLSDKRERGLCWSSRFGHISSK
jgi:hypothetical protein